MQEHDSDMSLDNLTNLNGCFDSDMDIVDDYMVEDHIQGLP